MHLHDILVGLINSLKCYFYETFSFPVGRVLRNRFANIFYWKKCYRTAKV